MSASSRLLTLHVARHRVPVHPPDLDRRIVPAPIQNVSLGDPVRAQRTFRILPVDREIGAGADLRGSKAGVGFIRSARDHHVAIMVGETKDRPISPFNPPAPRQRGGAVIEMGLHACG